MVRRVLMVCCGVLVCSAVGCSGTRATDRATGGKFAKTPQMVADDIVRATNELRKKNGRQQAKENSALTKAAQAHADDMAVQDKMDEKGALEKEFGGKALADRVSASGYVGKDASGAIGAGQAGDPGADLINFWRSSAQHRGFLLREDFDEMGAGAARAKSGKWYFCLILAASK